MKISNLPLATNPTSTDVLPLDRNGITYKMQYQALQGPQGPQGPQGAKGDAGKGISTYTEYYAVNNSATPPADSAFGTAIVSPTASNRYLWNYTVIQYSDLTELTTDKRLLCVYGQTGPQGEQGPQGIQGETGPRGATGPGLPSGGTTGQVTRKASGTNYDTAWESVDSAPTANSGHLVASGGVKTALDDKLDTANVYNGLDKTASGYALDARQGKALNDAKAPVIINTVSGPIASFSDGADDLPVNDLTIGIDPVQSGSGDPSPSNVRPITGWDGVSVTRTGKNLLKYPYDDERSTISEVSITVNSDGTFDCSGTAEQTVWFNIYGANSTDVSRLKPLSWLGMHAGDTITVSSNGQAVLFGLQFNKADGTLTNPSMISVDGTGSTTGTIPSDAVYCYIGLRFLKNVTYSESNVMLQLEFGSTATAYEPYQGNTYTVSIPSTPGTVYGGTLDVTTGVLTVTHDNIASYNGETLPGKWISSKDVYAAGTTPTTGAQVVYELAEAQTYQLNPIEVKTLLGDNCIWADCGPTVVEYRADTGLFIAKETAAIRSCIAPTEDGATASQAYAQGEYFFRGGNFCKAKTSIASGASFTLNTNYEITTVTEQLILFANA